MPAVSPPAFCLLAGFAGGLGRRSGSGGADASKGSSGGGPSGALMPCGVRAEGVRNRAEAAAWMPHFYDHPARQGPICMAESYQAPG